MNFKFFKHETKQPSPVEEIKETDIEAVESPEEISGERIESLKEYNNEMVKDSQITEEDIENALQDPEKLQSLGKKVSLLHKVVETLKDYTPAILAGSAAATGIAVLANMDLPVSLDEMFNSGAYQAEKMKVFLTMMPTLVAGLFSLLTAIQTKKERSQESITENHNNLEGLAA